MSKTIVDPRRPTDQKTKAVASLSGATDVAVFMEAQNSSGGQSISGKPEVASSPLALCVEMDEIAQQRINFVIPATTAEYAVMAGSSLQVMHFAILPHAGTEILRRDGLSD